MSPTAPYAVDPERERATAALLTRVARSADCAERAALLEQVVQGNLGVVEAIATQLAGGRLEDVQVRPLAYLALARAARDHDLSTTAPFLPSCLARVRSDLQRMIEARAEGNDDAEASPPETEPSPQCVDVFVDGGVVFVTGLGAEDVVRRLKRGHHAPTYVALHDGSPEGDDETSFPAHDLTEREAEVVRRITAGMSNRDLAASLYLGVNTVKTYIRTAYRKMGVTTRSQAVLWGVRHGLGPDRTLTLLGDQEESADGDGPRRTS